MKTIFFMYNLTELNYHFDNKTEQLAPPYQLKLLASARSTARFTAHWTKFVVDRGNIDEKTNLLMAYG